MNVLHLNFRLLPKMNEYFAILELIVHLYEFFALLFEFEQKKLKELFV